jgi:hypothetical protein
LSEQVNVSNPLGGIYGNVGIARGGQIQGSGPQIHGDLYLGNDASAQFSGNYSNNRPVTGKVHLGSRASLVRNSYSFTALSDSPQLLLTQARNNALTASNLASSLTPTSALKQINLSHVNMTLSAGVYDLSSLTLDHSTLTLRGPGYFVFNITSQFTLNSGKILLGGRVTEGNVLFNYTGLATVAFSGGTGGTFPGGADESVLHGILLALNGQVNLAPGLVVGEIISASNISLVSGSAVQQPQSIQVPEHGTTIQFALLAIGAVILLQILVRRAAGSQH